MSTPKCGKKAPEPKREPYTAHDLNEQARLYPWVGFNQGELELMTGYPREAISAAFASPDFPSQFSRSRPEDVFEWVRKQDVKVQTKEAKNL